MPCSSSVVREFSLPSVIRWPNRTCEPVLENFPPLPRSFLPETVLTLDHSALGRSPVKVLYGHPPRHFGITNVVCSCVRDVESMLDKRETMLAAIRQHLLRAQQRMKSQADKNRSERSFEVGDSVYLRLQPYVQSSLAPRSHHKLCFKYFGPFKIISKIGSVAYKLQLPASSSIHPSSMCPYSSQLLQLRSLFQPTFQTPMMVSRFLSGYCNAAYTSAATLRYNNSSSDGRDWVMIWPHGKTLTTSCSTSMLLRPGDRPVPKEGGCQ